MYNRRIFPMTSLPQPAKSPARAVPLALISSTKSRVNIPDDNQDLNHEITRLAGHINAAQYRFLKLLSALIERNAWGGDSGIKSPAHWLNYYCGIAQGAAREKVRVALCLDSLPLIDQAFQTGAISYSKVRAMTRSATADNEEFLLQIAKHGTAQHVENLIRKYRRSERLQSSARGTKATGLLGDGEKIENQHQVREFSSYYDDDGMLVFKGKLTPEEGAVFLKALEIAFTNLNSKSVPAGTDLAKGKGAVAANECVKEPDGLDKKESFTQKRADALSLMAEHSLQAAQNKSGAALSNGDKYQVVVHLEAKPQQDKDAILHTHAWLENGPALCPDTLRRLACDASVVTVLEDSAGKVLNVGRKTRAIPPSIRRALSIRDQGCRVPGCCESGSVDAHHIQHWCDGGETSLDNLVLLCRHHHRLLHQGVFRIETKISSKDSTRKREEAFVFIKPNGQVIPQSIYPQYDQPKITIDGALEIEIQHRESGLDIDAKTAVSAWRGERMDYGLALDVMWERRTLE